MIAPLLRGLEQVFGWLLSASWQASVLALLVLAVQAVLRGRLNPRWRYALWLLVLLRLIVPALPESALSLFQFAPPPPTALTVTVTEPLFVAESALPPANLPPESTPPVHLFSFYTLLALAWLAGATVLFVLTALVNWRFARQVASSPAVTDPELRHLFADARAELGVRRSIRLIESGQVQSPAIMGLFQPTLLLPGDARTKFDPRELRLIFLHELAHLKRGDVVVQGLIALLQIVHWFNPVLWYAFRRMRIDREPATDALVLSRAGEAEKERYGLMLIKLLEHFNRRHSLTTLVGILEDKDQFKRRFSLIARFTRGAYGWSLLGILLIVLLAVACLTKAKAATKTTDEKAPAAKAGAVPPGLVYLQLDIEEIKDRDYLAHQADIDAAVLKGDAKGLQGVVATKVVARPGVYVKFGEEAVISVGATESNLDRSNLLQQIDLTPTQEGGKISVKGRVTSNDVQGNTEISKNIVRPNIVSTQGYVSVELGDGQTKCLQSLNAPNGDQTPETLSGPYMERTADGKSNELVRLFFFLTARTGAAATDTDAKDAAPESADTTASKPVEPAAANGASAPAPDKELLQAREDADARHLLVDKARNLSDDELVAMLQGLGRTNPQLMDLDKKIAIEDAETDTLLKKGYDPDHPRIQSMRTDIALLQKERKQMVDGVRRALDIDAKMGDSRVGRLTSESENGTAQPDATKDLDALKKALLAAKEDADARRVLIDKVRNLTDAQFVATMQAMSRADPEITVLEDKINQETIDVANLLKDGFAENHPRVLSMRAEIGSLRKEEHRLVEGLHRAMDVDLQMADSRVSLLREEVDAGGGPPGQKHTSSETATPPASASSGEPIPNQLATPNGPGPFTYQEAIDWERLDLAKKLVDSGTPITAIDFAAALSEDRPEIVKLFWEHGAHDCSELTYAISQGATAAQVDALLKNGTSVNPAEDVYLSPLSVASGCGNLPVANLLLAHGADPKWRGKSPTLYSSPMRLAVAGRQPEIVQALLDHGATFDPQDFQMAMMYLSLEMKARAPGAPYQKATDVFRILVSHGAVEQVPDKMKGPFLTMACLTVQDPDVVKLLLAHGFNPTEQGLLGTTVLQQVRDAVAGKDNWPPTPALQPVLDILEKWSPATTSLAPAPEVIATTYAPGVAAATPASAATPNSANPYHIPTGLVRVSFKVIEIGEDDYQAHRADIEAAVQTGDPEPIIRLKSFDLLSEPAVVTKSGERGVLEAVRVFPFPIKYEKDASGKIVPTNFDHRDIGVRLPIEVIVKDGKIDINGKLEMTSFQGFIKSDEKTFSACFNTREAYYFQELQSGQTRGMEAAGSQVQVDLASVPAPGHAANPTLPAPKLARLFFFLTAWAGPSAPETSVVKSAAPTPAAVAPIDHTVQGRVFLPKESPNEIDFADSTGELLSIDGAAGAHYSFTFNPDGAFVVAHVQAGVYNPVLHLAHNEQDHVMINAASPGVVKIVPAKKDMYLSPVTLDDDHKDATLNATVDFTRQPAGSVTIAFKIAEIDDAVYQANKAKVDAAVEKGDLASLNNLKGVSLLSAPTVTTMPGQKANIDIVREFPYPTAFEDSKLSAAYLAPHSTQIVPSGPGGKTNLILKIPMTPREFVTKDVGVSAEIEPTLPGENSLEHGKIVLNGKFTVTDFEGFTKSNLEGVNMPSFSTRESLFIEAVAENELTGVWIPGAHFDDQTITDQLPSGKTTTVQNTAKKRMLLFLSARLVK
jgi:beta-lactamase regulating signal transducer with metallopeptidase domain